MNELIEVPKWFDDIYKEVIRVIEDDFSYIHKPEDKANELLIKAISNHGYGEFWTDDLIREILFPSVALVTMIKHKEEEKIDYVGHNKIDLIKAIINGYKVKEDSYLVVSRNDYENKEYIYDNSTTSCLGYVSQIVKYKQLYYYEDDKQLEKFKELDSNLLTSGLIFGKFKPELIKQIQETEPRLIMNEEKAKNLVNGYRIIVPISI